MKTALDATPLALSSGGLRRYTSELARALAESFPDDEYILVSDQSFALPGPVLPNLRQGIGARNALERRWWSWGLNRRLLAEGAEVFHGTNFEAPYVPLRPSVVTLHDLSPWLEATWHHAAGRVRRRAPLVMGLGLATLVITVSEAIRREAIAVFRLHPGRVVAVPLAASPGLRPVEAPPPGTPYFLYLGTLEPRKNLALLLDAWREAHRQHPVDLVLAGRRRSDFAPLPPEPGLRILNEVGEGELSALYSGALAFVYPSLYEGFGLPVLEAMQCGAAVIASSDPAVTEVAGGAALQLDARDPRAWAEALTAAASRPEWVRELRARALQRAGAFSWSRTARLTREVYEEARRRFGGW